MQSKLDELKQCCTYHVAPRAYYNNFLYKVRLFGLHHTSNYGFLHFRKTPEEDAPLLTDEDILKIEMYLRQNKLQKGKDFKMRREWTTTFYFKDPFWTLCFVESFKNLVIDVYGPMNNTHSDLMVEDYEVVAKDNLWFRKYRWKVEFYGDLDFVEKDIIKIKNYLDNIDKTEYLYSPNVKRINFHHKVGMASHGSHIGTPNRAGAWGPTTPGSGVGRPGRPVGRRGGGLRYFKLRYIYKWSICSIYCKAIEDVLVLKMIAPNSLKKIIKCVTFNELK